MQDNRNGPGRTEVDFACVNFTSCQQGFGEKLPHAHARLSGLGMFKD